MVKEHIKVLSYDNSRKNVRQEWRPKFERKTEHGGNPNYLSKVCLKEYTFLNKEISREKEGMAKGKSYMV